MAYTYLFDIYRILEENAADARTRIKTESLSTEELKYQQGRLDLVEEFRTFVSKNLDAKLPRRLRKQLKPEA